VYSALIFTVGWFYLVGAFLTWWVIDQSVSGRSFIAALWPVMMPIEILGEQLGKRGSNDDE
jgi:hypothetical protein